MKAKTINDLLGREATNNDFYNLKEIVIADGVENIYNQAFNKFRKLKSVILSDSVTSIDEFAFLNRAHLSSVIISKSVQKIGMQSFKGCTSLDSIIVDKDNKIFDSRDNCNAIINTKNKELIIGSNKTIIPDGVKKISRFAFTYCLDITSIRIPASLHVFSINTFYHDVINSIVVDNKNNVFDSRDNCNAIIRTNTKTLIYGCNSSIIPDGVESIGYRAFDGCIGLTSIIIPEGVKSIGEKAFYDCKNLVSIFLPMSLVSIENRAFTNCHKTKVFYIPSGSKEKFDALLPQFKNNLVEV